MWLHADINIKGSTLTAPDEHCVTTRNGRVAAWPVLLQKLGYKNDSCSDIVSRWTNLLGSWIRAIPSPLLVDGDGDVLIR